MSIPAFSVRNPVFANLFMILIMAFGAFYALTTTREMFPELKPLAIVAGTPYPGASPYEVERGICMRIEEKVADITGVETVRSVAREGASGVVITLQDGVKDTRRVKEDVQNAIDQITDFPSDAEETVVVEVEPIMPVIAVSLFGEVDPLRLRNAAERLKDEIQQLPGISDVTLFGVREREIVVEVRPESLLRWNITFAEVVRAIRASNLNVPGGVLKTAGGEFLLRTVGEAKRPEELGALLVRALPDGRRLTLARLATVRETFKETSLWGRFKGMPAIDLVVNKRAHEDAIYIADQIRTYLDQRYRRTLPPQIRAETHRDLSKYIRQRIDLMIRNGTWGLILVFISLTVFLSLRMSFWVAIGLPVSFLGAFIVMHFVGVTVNLLSLFGLIVVLGMIVDDAIIVGENVYRHVEEGMPVRQAAILGTEEVSKPVVTAILTTIASFMPLVLVGGRMGQFMWVLPVVVTAALAVSLIEALVILPSHLAEWLVPPKRADKSPAGAQPESAPPHRPGFGQRVRERIMQRTLIPAYRRLLTLAVSWRYVTIALMFSLLAIVLGVAVNFVGIIVFPKLDSDILVVEIEMPVGTPAETTERVLRRIETRLDHWIADKGGSGDVNNHFTTVGLQFDTTGASALPLTPGSHRGQIFVELAEPDERTTTSTEIANRLRDFARTLPGIAHLTVKPLHGGPGGADVEIELRGDDLEILRAAVDEIGQALGRYHGVREIEDSYRPGKREIVLRLTEAGRAMGLTVADLARQVRGAFYGLDAGSVQQARDELDIVVRFPEADRRRLADLESLRIATPAGRTAPGGRLAPGGRVPLSEVATVSFGRGLEKITRTDRKRTITITAVVDSAAGANAEEILAQLRRQYADIGTRFPGTSMAFKGQARELRKSLASLKYLFPLSLLLIYLMLASLFRSYLQPLVVMVAIPLGMIGAVTGHLIMGMEINILSMIGMVALTGIVVNDSLIMVDFVNRKLKEEPDPVQAVIESGILRLRPILLTSITTILGLAPLMGETSFQARILIGMAVSITFGLAFATVLVLVAVPCLYLILLDLQRVAYRIRHGQAPPKNWSPRRSMEDEE